MIAVLKSAIKKPGTNLEVPKSKATLIKNAAIPKVRMEIGSAINCNIGLIRVLTIPIAIAATTAVQILANWKPGTRYSTTRSAKTFIAKRIKSVIH